MPSTVSEFLKEKKTFSPEKIFPISFWFWAVDFRAPGQKFRKVH